MVDPQAVVKGILAETLAAKNIALAPTALVEYCGYDHVAAILLNQIAYWSSRTKNPDGWFYKRHADWETEIGLSEYQVRRCLYGDSRSKNPRCVLTKLGVETQVKLAPDGKRATYYRVNWQKFFIGLLNWVSETYGVTLNKITRAVKELRRFIGDPDASPSKNTTAAASPSVPSPLVGTTSAASDDPQPDVFSFVRQQPEPLPISERVNLPWENAYSPDETMADAWKMAHNQLDIRFDRMNFNSYMRDAILVDYDPETLTFTLAAKTQHQADMLQHRLYRDIRRVLSDVVGQEVEITAVSHQDWRDRHR